LTTSEQTLKAGLESIGFTTEKNPLNPQGNLIDWYAYRRSDHPARRCECNRDKAGMQIVIYPFAYHFPYDKEGLRSSVSVEICGEAGGVWWELQAYAIPLEELLDRLPEVEASLVRAWNALVNTTDNNSKGNQS